MKSSAARGSMFNLGSSREDERGGSELSALRSAEMLGCGRVNGGTGGWDWPCEERWLRADDCNCDAADYVRKHSCREIKEAQARTLQILCLSLSVWELRSMYGILGKRR